jgi:hypothetical protein
MPDKNAEIGSGAGLRYFPLLAYDTGAAACVAASLKQMNQPFLEHCDAPNLNDERECAL